MEHQQHFSLFLICDGQPLSPYILKMNQADLRQRASRAGLEPSALFAKELRTQLSQSYTLTASEAELQTIVTLLLNYSHNQTRPLVVHKKATPMTTTASDNLQIEQLEQRLRDATKALHQERSERRRERDTHQRELRDTQTTLKETESVLQQARFESDRQRRQLNELGDVRAQLTEAQQKLDLLSTERSKLEERIERLKDNLDQTRDERAQVQAALAAVTQERDAIIVRAQELEAAYTQSELIRYGALDLLSRILPNPLPPDYPIHPATAQALAEYRRRMIYEPTF